MSYPLTFLTTRPPPLATFPSGVATLMPIRKSRGDPKRRRSGPVHPVASRPPIVWPGELNGSSGKNCADLASSCWSDSSVMPASTLTTMSACECSITLSSRVVCSSTSHRSGAPPIPLGPAAADRHHRKLRAGSFAELAGEVFNRRRHLDRCGAHHHFASMANPVRPARCTALRVGSGKILPGFRIPVGSNTSFTRCIAPRSSSE